MRYLLSIFRDESLYAEHPERLQAARDGYRAYGEAVVSAGVLRAGEALEGSATATVVRVAEGTGEPLIVDGPFAETEEQLGGFYLLECEDLDEAIRWAQKIPDARWGAVEIRPVMDYAARGMRPAREALGDVG